MSDWEQYKCIILGHNKSIAEHRLCMFWYWELNCPCFDWRDI